MSITATLIDAVCVPVFKTLYLSSDTASAHTRFSVNKVVLEYPILGFSATQAVLSLKVAERTCFASRFLTGKCGHVTEGGEGGRLWDFLFLYQKIDGTSCVKYRALQYCLAFVRNSTTLKPSVPPS